MSSRPVYIPPGRRNKNNKQQQQQRFHGAFTGGFSAGYFNTVDTKEGWKPSNDTKKRQRLEDFMDEQDHEEWGGPTNVRREYNKAAAATTTTTATTVRRRSSSSSKNSNNEIAITKYQQDDSHNQLLLNQESQKHHFSLDSLFSISHQSVGPRLLRRLGWREEEGGDNKAFVPSHDDDDDDDDDGVIDNHGENDNNNNNVSSSTNIIILSKKRLRKIKLQTSRINIPVPKLDVCGLGFDPHTNAPEFKQYFNRRKQLARERGVMIDGGSRSNNNNNVYRTSAIMMKTSNENDKNKSSSSSSNHHPTRDKRSNINKNVNQGDDYLSYETAEDFVGKRSVGGFALRDDEDDAYDKDEYRRPTRMQLGDEYNSEIYEHQDSDNDDDGDPVMLLPRGGSVEADGNSIVQLHQKKTDLGGLLASWAATTTTTTTAQQGSSSSTIGLTSDGRHPLEGFVLGGCMQSHKKRYPGPDIPREYITRRHKFGENEHPLIFQTIARAVQLQEREKQRRDYNKRQNLQMTMLQQKSFSNLASAMKSRFITSSSKEEESKGPERIGLYMPELVVQKEGIESTTGPAKELTTVAAVVASEKPISIKRTVQSFLPHPLLCKRFGVPVPKNAIGIDPSQTNSYTQHPGRKQTEANYFEKEILTARTKNNNSNNNKESSKGSTSGDNRNIQDDKQEDADEKPSGIQRPSMEKLKSIFEAQSDLESSDTDLDASSDDDDDDDDEYGRKMNVDKTVENPTAIKGKEEESSQQMVVYEENDKGEQSDSSSSSTTTSSSSIRHRKEHRKRSHHRRHKSKKRRKRSRSPDDSDDDDDDDKKKRRKERRRKHERRRRRKSSRRKER